MEVRKKEKRRDEGEFEGEQMLDGKGNAQVLLVAPDERWRSVASLRVPVPA